MATTTEAAAATAAPQGTTLERAQAWVRQRWIYAIVAVVLFAGVIFALTQAASATYVPVAKDMLPEDQQSAVAALEAKNIPFKLSASSISVPEDKVYEARMELAVSGSTGGKVTGFELFDNNTMGRSTFSQKVNFRRAMEGELSRTISTLKSVDRARVHLVMPERRLFQRDQASPTASVVVTLKRGMILSKRQVGSIQQLVGGAVEGLMPQQVAVVDQFGQPLAQADGSDGKAAKMIERTMSFERTLESRIVSLLEPTIGRGRVRAKVAARLDFSSVSEQEEKYDPESATVRSEREKLEKTEGSAKPARGAPGTASNLPTRRRGQQNPPFTKPSKADRSDTTKNYVVDRKITQRQIQSPRVEKLSVAVVIDVIRKPDGTVDRQHSTKELEAYTKLLTNAVGLDDNRGDTIEVASMPFTPDIGLALDKPDEVTPKGPTLMEYVMYGLAGLGLLLLLVILFLVIRARRPKDAEVVDEAERLEHLEADAEGEAAREELAELGLQAEIANLRQKAVAQSQNDILVTASVIRNWLHSSEEVS